MTLPEDHERRTTDLLSQTDMKSRPSIDRCRIPLNALRAFEATGRHLSFAAGAQSLHVTYGAVRRQVAGLEEMLQTKLVARQNNSLTLTSHGHELLCIVSRAFDEIEEHLNKIQSRENAAQERIRLTLPPLFLHHVGGTLLRDLRRQFPQVSLDISSDELPTDRRTYDLAVVHDSLDGDRPAEDLLWPCRIGVFCAPGLAPLDESPDLASYFATSTLLHVRSGRQPGCPDWRTFAARTGIRIPDPDGIVFSSQAAAIAYACAGGGLVLSDQTLLKAMTAYGALVRPCTHAYFDGFGYFLSVRSREPAGSYFAGLCRALTDRDQRDTSIGFPKGTQP